MRIDFRIFSSSSEFGVEQYYYVFYEKHLYIFYFNSREYDVEAQLLESGGECLLNYHYRHMYTPPT